MTTSSPPLKRAPQRIIVLCDGTWQARRNVGQIMSGDGPMAASDSDSWFSNVALLSECIEQTGSSNTTPRTNGKSGPIAQTVLYQSGIGTTPSLLTNLFYGATGGTLGLKVCEAYSYVVDNYQLDDELLFFGFSRGAYTARTLADFINYAGILTKIEVARSLKTIWNAYIARNPSKPDTVKQAEDIFFHQLGRWPSGNAMRTGRGNVAAATSDLGPDLAQDQAAPLEGRYPRVDPPTIQVVGVWDTVGALGVPGFGFLQPNVSKYFSFFDPVLAPTIRHAFHALALGEDRKDFLPSLWYLPAPGKEAASDHDRRSGQVLRQMWFQGAHKDVGGGFEWHGLSDITLAWMISQLTDTGDGQPPLVSVNIQRAKRLQDRRKAWARQKQHPSRASFTFQATRNVGAWNISQSLRYKAIWKDMISQSITNESVHHSVVGGDRYTLEKSPQFAVSMKERPTEIQAMWTAALDASTLGPTERALAWKKGTLDTVQGGQNGSPSSLEAAAPMPGLDDSQESNDKVPATAPEVGAPSHANGGASKPVSHADAGIGVSAESLDTYDPNLPPQRPVNVSLRVWDVLMAIGWTGPKTVAFVVNLGPRPTDNLQPGILLNLLGKATKKSPKSA